MCNVILKSSTRKSYCTVEKHTTTQAKMAMKDAQSIVFLLLLSSIPVLSYFQFVVPGTTEADSSPIYVSQLYYVANRTVDGNFSQNYRACLHTAISGVTEAWLRIDLQTVRSIKSVKFWYRNDRGSESQSTVRLRGYSIHVSNSSNVHLSPGSKDACFTDDMSNTLPTVIQEECKKTTRYVWFYQPHKTDSDAPILEICEVQVFGCETGSYGDNCSRKCDHCKNSDTCDIDTGECDENGCSLPGYQPPRCDECRLGSYGSNCRLNCSSYCQEEACERSSGECLYDCKPGYQKPDCVMPCMHGYYGKNCTNECGNCLINQTCNNVNGTCIDGCSEGFKGDLCITKCSSYEYGRNCQNQCSYQCYNNETCDPFFGNCSRCTDGYRNEKCDEKCNSGTYGENCTHQCGECINAVICDHVNGTCFEGCKPGWQNTDTCQKPCRNGTYGIDCVYNCSGNCESNDTCDKATGTCSKCAPGWKNQYCNKNCDVGLYGSNCQETCGRCLKVDNCSFTDGTCLGGCIDGYTGDTCYERTQSLHKEPKTPGAAVIAAPVVVIVVLITVIVAVVILRKRQPPKKKENSVQLQAIPEQDEEVKIPAGDEVYYTNQQIHAKHIKIRELRSTIHSLEHDIEEGFEKEFRAIPYGENPEIPCTVGKLTENMVKNRFKTTFPYDHSRVILESTENGDYINANYIKNANGETVYIASQGPRPNTVVDFWQMVWQENVSVIAMIKCERYWPEVDGSKIKKGEVQHSTYIYENLCKFCDSSTEGCK